MHVLDVDTIEVEWWMDECAFFMRVCEESNRLASLGTGHDVAENEELLRKVTKTCKESARQFLKSMASYTSTHEASETQGNDTTEGVSDIQIHNDFIEWLNKVASAYPEHVVEEVSRALAVCESMMAGHIPPKCDEDFRRYRNKLIKLKEEASAAITLKTKVTNEVKSSARDAVVVKPVDTDTIKIKWWMETVMLERLMAEEIRLAIMRVSELKGDSPIYDIAEDKERLEKIAKKCREFARPFAKRWNGG